MSGSSGLSSNSPQVLPQKTPKAMSSRLLTMKFMQRAASSSSPATPSSPEQPSPKRRRTDDSSPKFDVDSLANQRAIQNALADEEAKRQAALDRQAADAGDTRWILNFKSDGKSSNGDGITASPIRVVPAGFAAIDKASLTTNYEVSVDSAGIVGRKSFGRFNKAIEKLQHPDYESSSDSDSDSSEDDYRKSSSEDEDEDPETTALIREEREAAVKKLKAERKAKRKAEKAELVRLAEKRKKRDVNLNDSRSLKSISSGGGDMRTCHNCGEIGHQVSNCPRPRQKSRRREDEDQNHTPIKARKLR